MIHTSKENSQADDDKQTKPTENLQEKKICNLKTKFEKSVLFGSIKNENKRREVSPRLTLAQLQGSDLSLKGILQTLKNSKVVKDLSFKFDRLNENHLKILEEAVSARRSSLNSISFSIAKCKGITLTGLNKLITLIGKFSSLQQIYISLNLCENLDNSTCNNLLSTLNKFPNLKRLHLDFYKNCNYHFGLNNQFFDNLITYLPKQSQLQGLGLNLTAAQEIPDKIFKEFLGALEQLQSLQTLRFEMRSTQKHKSMTDPKIKKLCTHMKKFQHLQTLDINFFGSSVSNIGITPFAACLKQFPLLHTLNLNFSGGVSITAECLKTLSNALVKVPNLHNLRFDLTGCAVSVGDSAIINLSKGLASLTGLTSFSLHLSGNLYLKDEGLTHLGKSLQKIELLKSLCLMFPSCDQITPEGVNEIIKTLEKLTFLQNFELSFSGSKKITGEVLTSILQAVSYSKSLKSLALDFSKCEIIDQDLQALPSVFKKLDFLQKLTLSLDHCMELSDLGFFGLCRCFPHLISLQHLQLSFSSCYKITHDATLGLKDVFVNLPLLKTIDFEDRVYHYSVGRSKSYEDIQKSLPFKQINITSKS